MLNSVARQKASERIKELGSSVYLYTFVFLLVTGIVSIAVSFVSGLIKVKLLTFVISLVSIIAIMAISYGFLEELINLYENVGGNYLDFLSIGLEKWKTVLKVDLKLALKGILGIILMAVGSVAFSVGIFVGLFARIFADLANGPGSLLTIGIIGGISYILGLIVLIPIYLKYFFVFYEMANGENDQNIEGLFDKSERYTITCRKQLFANMLYWSVITGLEFMVVERVLSKLGVLALIIEFLILMYNMPRMILSFQELYKDISSADAFWNNNQANQIPNNNYSSNSNVVNTYSENINNNENVNSYSENINNNVNTNTYSGNINNNSQNMTDNREVNTYYNNGVNSENPQENKKKPFTVDK